MNSSSFVNKAVTWEKIQVEIQVSCDVMILHPSILIDKAITVFVNILNNDLDDLNICTKFTLSDIRKLTELLIKSYFLYEKKIRLLENAGSIDLSFMAVLSESYLHHLEGKTISEVLTISYKRNHLHDM